MSRCAIGRGLLLALVSVACTTAREVSTPAQRDEEYTRQRREMVDAQLRQRGIRDVRVLEAMGRVPRHRFVLQQDQAIAYGDHPIPIGLGQTISQPYIVAFMTEALVVAPQHKVLEIGTGSGYQAAILGELAREVYTIEIVPELAERGKRVIAELGYKNVHVRAGDGYNGWPEQAPFDSVIVTAAPDHVPQPLIDQVKVGGRLVVPVGTGVQQLLVYTRTEKGLLEESRLPVRFVPLTRKP